MDYSKVEELVIRMWRLQFQNGECCFMFFDPSRELVRLYKVPAKAIDIVDDPAFLLDNDVGNAYNHKSTDSVSASKDEGETEVSRDAGEQLDVPF